MGWSIRRKLGGTPVGSTAASKDVDTRGRLLPDGRLQASPMGLRDCRHPACSGTSRAGRAGGAGEDLERVRPRYLGCFVSCAVTGGVQIAHSNMTRFIEAAHA